MLSRAALVRTDVSEERTASLIRVTWIGEMATLAVTSNQRRLRRNAISYSFSENKGSDMAVKGQLNINQNNTFISLPIYNTYFIFNTTQFGPACMTSRLGVYR
jgi:hypothetical protein